MKLARYKKGDAQRLGLVAGGNLFDLAEVAKLSGSQDQDMQILVAHAKCGDMKSVLELQEQGVCLLAKASEPIDANVVDPNEKKWVYELGGIRLLAPVPNPGKILCLAGNYYEGEGCKETDKSTLRPRVFIKPRTTLIGPGDDIQVPSFAEVVVPEIELAVVIGKRGRDISLSEADDYIWGYAVFNDFTARKLRLPRERLGRPRDLFFDWLNGKWFDTFAVAGPWLTSKSEIHDAGNLNIVCRVNGEIWTEGSTRDMIFTPQEIIAYISRIATLEPGDLIATGVPVHEHNQPPIKSGDLIEGEIEGLGKIINQMVRI